MNIKISYSKRSEKFLSKNLNIITEEEVDDLIVKAAKVIFLKEEINIDLKKMKGSEFNLYRIRKGKIRLIFTISKNEIIMFDVNDIGFRGDIY